METATLSTKYQLVIPRGARERLGLVPGTKFTVLEKSGRSMSRSRIGSRWQTRWSTQPLAITARG